MIVDFNNMNDIESLVTNMRREEIFRSSRPVARIFYSLVRLVSEV